MDGHKNQPLTTEELRFVWGFTFDTPTEEERGAKDWGIIPTASNKIDEVVIDNDQRKVWSVNKEPSWSVGKKKPNPENRDPRYREGQGTFEGITLSYKKWAQEASFNMAVVWRCSVSDKVYKNRPKDIPTTHINVHVNSIQLGAGGLVTAYRRYPAWTANRTLHLYNSKNRQRTHKVSVKYNGNRLKVNVVALNPRRLILNRTIEGEYIGELIEASKSKNEEGYVTYGMQTDTAFTLANAFHGIRTSGQGSVTHQSKIRAWIEAVKKA